jgi:hypothetical protein
MVLREEHSLPDDAYYFNLMLDKENPYDFLPSDRPHKIVGGFWDSWIPCASLILWKGLSEINPW